METVFKPCVWNEKIAVTMSYHRLHFRRVKHHGHGHGRLLLLAASLLLHTGSAQDPITMFPNQYRLISTIPQYRS
jgi:hypothetical protein